MKLTIERKKASKSVQITVHEKPSIFATYHPTEEKDLIKLEDDIIWTLRAAIRAIENRRNKKLNKPQF